MAAWEPFSITTSEADAERPDWGGLRDWPKSVVRWLFGWGDDDREPQSVARVGRPGSRTSASAARPARAAARSPGSWASGWAGRSTTTSCSRPSPTAWSCPSTTSAPSTSWRPSVVQDWLLPLREEHYAPQEAYLDHLAKLIEAIGRAGESVLVGRGAGFMLPRETTLSVRIIAPLRARAAPAGRADGRLGPDRPPGRQGPRPPPRPSSTGRCTG